MKTTVLGYRFRKRSAFSARIKWKWRAVVTERRRLRRWQRDSAANVYVTFRRALRWYSLKYVWSTVGKKGATCDRKRNPFRAQDTIVVDSGPPLDEWRAIEINPDEEFKKHFEGGDPQAPVPDLVGIAIMTDGDQTSSTSEADYGGFSLVLR
jgi:hypothetical protein